MKLSIGHNEIILGLVAYLETRGIKGFDPLKVHASFSISRKDGTLSCELDEDAPVAKVAAEQVETVKEVKASAKAAEVNETPAACAGDSATKNGENAVKEAAPASEATAAVEPAAQVAGDQAAAAETSGEENLFG